MRLPPLTDPELAPFLREGLWVAKIATHNPDGTVRMTPLTYGLGEDEEIIFTTWQDTSAVRNLQRNPEASVLIDKVDQPYAGVHFVGTAETGPAHFTGEQYAQIFGRYTGDLEQAARSYDAMNETMNGLGLGPRYVIRFRPRTKVTWDFAKIPNG